MALRGWALLFLIVGVSTALSPTGHQTKEVSLRSALDAVARKQRSLDANSQEFYNDLHSFKYHGNSERKFEREQQGEREIDEEDSEIEFLPNEAGQLETVGNGFQGVNNKLVERALMDYLETTPEQEEEPRVPSVFRERERSSSRKRGDNYERTNVDNKELERVLLEEQQDGLGDMTDEEYIYALKILFDQYRAGRGKRIYDTEGSMSWGELLNNAVRGQARENEDSEFADRDQEQNVLYLSPAERRNVNGRYPIGRDFRTYRNMAKRYPVAKRSPKPLPAKKQITDPKVAQDLGALFGTQSTESVNHTDGNGHDHDHDHDHSHDHDHDHNHDHDHDHEHEHEHGEQRDRKSSTESPKVSPPPKGQEENATKVGKSKSIEVRKKSVDWSQYFGIDRRKKRATFMARQGTQNQDAEWMLQRYYENMAENLRPNERDYDTEAPERKDKLEQMDTNLKNIKDLIAEKAPERKDKLEQIDTNFKNIKDLILEEALRYAKSGDGADLQEIKDKVMTRMAVAYSLLKMRQALNDLRNATSRIEAQRAATGQNNLTSNLRENSGIGRTDDKRSGYSGNAVDETEGTDDIRACPELEMIERRCKSTDNLAGDGTQMLYVPCVKLQICLACVQDELAEECLGSYAVDAARVCDAEELREGERGRVDCASIGLIISVLQPPVGVAVQCRMNSESCLRRYYRKPWKIIR